MRALVRSRRPYAQTVKQPLLMGDPLVAAMTVHECGEPLVSAGGAFALSPLKVHHRPFFDRVRQGIYDRLLAAQDQLPGGYRLLWVEGHRNPERQRQYFDDYRRSLCESDPVLTDAESYRLASRYVSPLEVAPHVSGAAIDISLCCEDGSELDLGTVVNASPEESGGACYFDAEIDAGARENRTILARALSGAGMVNYPTEWWHWSYGDRYWAATTSDSRDLRPDCLTSLRAYPDGSNDPVWHACVLCLKE